MQIKTTMRYHLTLVRMSIISKSPKAGEGVEKREPSSLLVGMHIGLTTTETAYKVLIKLKREVPYDPATSFLGVYLDKTINQKRNMHPYVQSSIMHNS